jgi:aspartate/tyrosine/aromatic aminotransferase
VLDCVRQAEAQMLAESGPKPYLPIEGAAPARTAVQALLFGAATKPWPAAASPRCRPWAPAAG